jgi:hypothetical protein
MSRNKRDVTLSWYDPESIAESIRNGLDRDIRPEKVAAHLAEHGFEEIPENRLRRIVDAMPPETKAPEQNHAKLSQPPETEGTPRTQYPRELMAGDFEYFSPREAARVLGVILELFDGNTVRPPETASAETDLIWHRQQRTVALRLVPLPDGAVGANHIQALVEGTVVPPETRSPSRRIVVTNRGFTDEATEAATTHNIHCFDGGQLEELVRRAKIPMDAVGTALEDGEAHDGPMTDLVEVSPIPEPRRTDDPLNVPPAFDTSALATDDGEPSRNGATSTPPSPGQPATDDSPLDDTQPALGETGTLYADPTEDGDYAAFDNYLEDL